MGSKSCMKEWKIFRFSMSLQSSLVWWGGRIGSTRTNTNTKWHIIQCKSMQKNKSRNVEGNAGSVSECAQREWRDTNHQKRVNIKYRHFGAPSMLQKAWRSSETWGGLEAYLKKWPLFPSPNGRLFPWNSQDPFNTLSSPVEASNVLVRESLSCTVLFSSHFLPIMF